MKQCVQRTSTEIGRETDVNDEQAANAADSIRRTLEPDSNRRSPSDEQFRKHQRQIISIDLGIQTDINDEQPSNTLDSIRRRRDPGSNSTSHKDEQFIKQFWPRI
jgi:hypothetical protein